MNHTGALATAAWDLTADEHHITGNCTLNAGSTQTLTPGATPNPIRFDGAFNITSTTSGLITGVGTSANRIRWQPNGAATTWVNSIDRYVYNNGSTGAWNLTYHDFVFCGPNMTNAASITFQNIRMFGGRSSGFGIYMLPSAGTTVFQDIEAHDTGRGTLAINIAPSGGTNTFQRIIAKDGGIGIGIAPTGGTNTINDIKAIRLITGYTIAGTVAITATNLIAIDCAIPVTGAPAVTSTWTRLIVSQAIDSAGVAAVASVPGAGVVFTLEEPYIESGDGSAVSNSGGTYTRMVVQNGVVYRSGSFVAASGLLTCQSLANDVVFRDFTGSAGRCVFLGSTDNDFLAGQGSAWLGAVPIGVEGLLQDWADANHTANVDVDSGNTASTSTPPMYGGPLSINRTNARATPNKPLTVTSIVATPGTNTVNITFTTGIKARSRLLIGTAAGVTRANATTTSPWKYHGILDPELVDFTLPVLSHSHDVPLPPGTYYYVPECYDPCGRRFLGAEGNFTIAAVAGGGAGRSAFAGAGMRVS